MDAGPWDTGPGDAGRAITRDRTLLDGCRRRDPQAWREVLDRYERLVFSIPLHHGLSRDDAADVCQIAFSALLEGLDNVRDETRLGAWLATVARRQTWRILAGRRRESLDGRDDPEQSSSADPIAAHERVVWLYEALLELEPGCRELLISLYFDTTQPSYAEVARRLGRPLGSIGPTRARCLERLRAALGEPA
ncbi:RNA polymerase sigma factor [Pseudonocardia nigra]|uniref:RNA polymerase sigma factor n=1 Tax=Pseudonocardia nigra TaxID=1921578 RepID=UPI001C5DD1FD|nr:sigma-70 family RNA polymerase sigma factor [Pseudonocardia nigra]